MLDDAANTIEVLPSGAQPSSARTIALEVSGRLQGLAFNRLAKAAAVPVVAEREPAYRD